MIDVAETKVKLSKDEIVSAIGNLTVLELADLVKALEEKFGVTAAAPMAVAAMPTAGGAAGAAQAEEHTEFDPVLKAIGGKKIQVIKGVRELTGLGLKEAKDLPDGAPSPVKCKGSKSEAARIQA